MMMRFARYLILFGTVIVSSSAAPAFADTGLTPPPKEAIEFFETKIRPILANNCYECHSAAAKSVKGAFVLDSHDGLLKGGESGKPALLAGQPEASRLVTAVKRTDPKFAMPPK